MFEKSFIDACLYGDAVLDDIDNYTEYWHTHDTGNELHELLGMTSFEYGEWLKSGEDVVLRNILTARRNGISYEEYIKIPGDAAKLFDAMEAAGYTYYPVESSEGHRKFGGGPGSQFSIMSFESFDEVAEWLDNAAFNDTEISNKVERILNPERFDDIGNNNADTEQDAAAPDKQRLFVDMDGTIAVFTPVDQLEKLYEKGWFEDAKPMDNVLQAVKQIIRDNPDIEVNILSAYLPDSKYALVEKNRWLDKYLPEIDPSHRVFVPCGSEKKDYIPGGLRSSDFLLDDYTKNLTLWQPPARGIKILNGINNTHGTWEFDRINSSRDPEEISKSITSVMHDGSHVYDDRLQNENDTAKRTIVVNGFGGPGAGKTNACFDIVSELKKRGYVADYVPEYATELVWDKNFAMLDGTEIHQKMIFDVQKHRIDRLVGKVDFVVTDSPLLLNSVYNKELTPEYESMVTDAFNGYSNFSFVIERDNKTFTQKGRIHNLEESKIKDAEIKTMLSKYGIYYGTYKHETVSKLIDNIERNHINLNEAEQKEKKPFELPPKAGNYRRLFAYLCSSCGLDKEIVQELVKQGKIYESVTAYKSKSGEIVTLNDAVFVGKDNEGKARSGFQQGLITKTDHPFKHEVAGSEKEYAFCIDGGENVDTVAVFDTPVNAVSHATIEKLDGHDYKAIDRIAQGGVAFEPLQHYLENHPNAKNVMLCTDADQAGKLKDKLLEAGYTPEKGYHCERYTPTPTGCKDYNEYLLSCRAAQGSQRTADQEREPLAGQEEDGFFPEAEPECEC